MSEGIDKVVSVLDSEGATVVTREMDSDSKEMARRAYDLFVKGGYDMIVAVPDNPVAANIAFNKLEGLSAAVCDSVEDASIAKENDANVLVIKNPDSQDLGNILAAATKKGGFQLGRARQQPRPVVRAQPKPHQEEDVPNQEPQKQQIKISMPSFLQKPQMQKPAERVRNIPVGPSRPGVVGWIKDSLGIIDSREDPARKSQQSADAAKARQAKKEKTEKN